MHILNKIEKNTQEQIKPIFDPYRNNLKNLIDSNIDNKIFSKNNFL